MKKYFRLTSLFFLGLILFASCKKDTPAPTAKISSTVVSNVVTFNVVATDANSYSWSFGDGSAVSTEQNPVHTYAEFGKDFTVTLTVTGGGGTVVNTAKVTIPAMTLKQMLAGITTAGKKWRIAATAEIIGAAPDASLTVLKTYPAGTLTMLGMPQVYTDEYLLTNDGKLTISPKGGGVFSGLVYCTVNGIANVPTAAGGGAGLTYATPYTPPTGLTYALNEKKNLTVSTTADGITAKDITYNDVMTLSFSAGGFIGLHDFVSECIVKELTNTSMKIAFFASIAPPNAPQVGKSTNVLIFSFEVAP
ncbi:MAG: PKD domain-containing protein [Bacteroidia bacterium]